MGNHIEIKALPYDEEGVLNLLISASSCGFSGFAEIYTTNTELDKFATRLISFPTDLNHIVAFEYGNSSGEWPYHLILQAQVIDGVGHSAMHVHMQSLVGMPENALADFYIPCEPAAINELGREIINWVSNPKEPIKWQPKD